MERKRYAFASTVPALSFAVARRYCTSTTTMMIDMMILIEHQGKL